MFKLTLATLAAVVALALPAHAAIEITVENIGSIFNESLALPAEATPGSGIGFQQFFEFTLPVQETVTLSMSDSAIGNLRIVGGSISLNNWLATSSISPFQPFGTQIEAAPLLSLLGGQQGTVAPDVLNAGSYFALVEGVSGGSPIHLAIDGTITAVTTPITAVPTPETSTWAMMAIGFGLMGLVGVRSRKGRLGLLAV
jgi:hypothetical protein